MIVTVTCNPAIDMTIRDDEVSYDIGGKGINVSKVLLGLNTKSLVTGLIGDDNKDVIIDRLDELKLPHHFVCVDGKVRTNTKKIVDDELFEDNEKGPDADEKKMDKLLSYLDRYVNATIVISGSAPANAADDYYFRMIERLKRNHNYVILDCNKALFAKGLQAMPDAIKPNRDEICDYLDCEYDEQLIIRKCQELIDQGISLVSLSLGSDGALFVSEEGIYRCKALEVEYRSAVGAGDAMVAAMAYGRENHLSIRETIKLSMALAATMVEMIGTGVPSLDAVMNHLKDVEIEEVIYE